MKILNLSNFTLQLLQIRRNKFLCSLFLFLIFSSVAQNSDSLPIKLFNASDLQQDSIIEKSKIIKGSLLNESVDETSSQIIIVEGSEIRKFGYTTLVDVLKNLPGFRTSQPGNSYEGETFLMRGLVGNEYVKFMINGVSIKPEAVNGMPIASQLPIRHADRIEIIFGANSASFGTDCMGGVINIVMPEVDHPVYAWSDISLISPSTSDFNLTLGGKAGKGTNLFRYQFFASSYLSNKINLKTTIDIFSLDTSSVFYPRFKKNCIFIKITFMMKDN